MSTPTAALGRFPYPHRTVAEVDQGRPKGSARVIGKHRCPVCNRLARTYFCGPRACLTYGEKAA